MTNRLSIRSLFRQYPDGIYIPYYQRHYVWGAGNTGSKDAVAYLTECLINAYRRGAEYFLQGMTFAGDRLVDGQQRLTYIYLTLRVLGNTDIPPILFDNRKEAQEWLGQKEYLDISDDADESSQDVYLYKHTLRTVNSAISDNAIDPKDFAEFILDKVQVLYIPLDKDADEIIIYQMMNGTKAPMDVADIIKADIMRMASDPTQPYAYDWELISLRARYANEWNEWIRWWNTAAVKKYYSPIGEQGIDLLLKLCLRPLTADFSLPLTYEEFRQLTDISDAEPYHFAKHIFERLRYVQRRFEDAYADPTAYNRLRAVMLLQPREETYRFMHLYFVEREIDDPELLRYYKLSFLGMSIRDIYTNEPMAERFDDLLASLSMADVYHSDTKRDVFNLLLRLNIDEDTKLGRKFDFSVWNNRSLEHIYSKSKVWHSDSEGRIYDGNDNPLPGNRDTIAADASFMPRSSIVNHDGTQLSEHCIGNLVLLYGENNASFGNASFEQKKLMFLAPGDMTVFQSRNLLHTVCVFAGNAWDHRSIVDNYNLTLKNLKIYYGVK